MIPPTDQPLLLYQIRETPIKLPRRRGQVRREGSKKGAILVLLRQPNGATMKDVMAATGWQAHSVRGFISGSIVKKMGLKVESQKRADGERAYSIA